MRRHPQLPDRNRRQLHPQPPKRVTVRKLPPQRGR